MRTGIYQIKSRLNNKVYIGSAINIDKRWRDHTRSLIQNKHHSIYLQRHFEKYGLEDLEFTILQFCEKENLIKLEQYYFNLLNPDFNIAKFANSSLGIKRRKETIEKLSKSHKGVKHPEWRNKLKSEKQGGENHWTKQKENPFNEESKRKMSESHKKLYQSGYKHPRSVEILQYDLQGNFVKEWGSVQEAINVYGRGISNNLTKRNKSAYGFRWKYKNKHKQ